MLGLICEPSVSNLYELGPRDSHVIIGSVGVRIFSDTFFLTFVVVGRYDRSTRTRVDQKNQIVDGSRGEVTADSFEFKQMQRQRNRNCSELAQLRDNLAPFRDAWKKTAELVQNQCR